MDRTIFVDCFKRCNDDCAYPKYEAIGPNLYLGSQSICLVGFCVSYYGWSYAQQTQIQFYFLKPFSLPHRIVPLLSLSICSLLSVFFAEMPTPIPYLLLIFIGQDKWRCYDYSRSLVDMGVQFHRFKVGV